MTCRICWGICLLTLAWARGADAGGVLDAVKTDLLEKSNAVQSLTCDVRMAMQLDVGGATAEIKSTGRIEYLRDENGRDLYRSEVASTTKVDGKDEPPQHQLTVSNGILAKITTRGPDGEDTTTMPADASSTPQLIGAGFWRALETDYDVKSVDQTTDNGKDVVVLLAEVRDADSGVSLGGAMKATRIFLDKRHGVVTRMDYLDGKGEAIGQIVFENFNMDAKLDADRFTVDGAGGDR